MNYELLKSVIENEAKLQGVTEYEIYYMSSSELSIDTLNKEPNSFSSGVSGGICLKVVHDGKLGYASSELMEEEEMKSLVSRAKSNAESTEKPDTVGIFKGSESYAELKNADYSLKGAAELKKITADLADAIYNASDKVAGGTATYGVTAGFTIRLSNSHGLNLETKCGVNLVQAMAVICDEGKYESAYDAKELKDGDVDLDSIAKDVVKFSRAKTVKEQIEKSGCKILGTILNETNRRKKTLKDMYYGKTKYYKYGKYTQYDKYSM
jgi:PmbA protein